MSDAIAKWASEADRVAAQRDLMLYGQYWTVGTSSGLQRIDPMSIHIQPKESDK